MDDDTRELIIRLCTRAGMIMEDASPTAIAMPSDDEAVAHAVTRITSDVQTICRLLEAAAALARPTIA